MVEPGAVMLVGVELLRMKICALSPLTVTPPPSGDSLGSCITPPACAQSCDPARVRTLNELQSEPPHRIVPSCSSSHAWHSEPPIVSRCVPSEPRWIKGLPAYSTLGIAFCTHTLLFRGASRPLSSHPARRVGP